MSNTDKTDVYHVIHRSWKTDRLTTSTFHCTGVLITESGALVGFNQFLEKQVFAIEDWFSCRKELKESEPGFATSKKEE